MTDESKIKIAKRAILHVLMRIKKDEQVARKFGAGSECFDLLTAAASALSGEPLSEIRDNISPGSSGLPYYTPEEILEEL